jgi:hypothetical protein
MGLDHEQAYRADGDPPYFYGFKTRGRYFATGGDFKGTKTGVRADGTEAGVYAVGSNTVGVYGEIIENGTGVFGLGHKEHVGVAGISRVKGNSMEGHSGIGIVGATEGSQGFGVVGLSVDSLVGIDPTNVPTVFIDDKDQVSFSGGSLKLSRGIGVVGASGSGSGVVGKSSTGYGVEGNSDSAAGVRGKSTSGYGGVFSSDNCAQISLIPKLDHLPDTADAGDLIAIMAEERPDTAELWFCVTTGNPTVGASAKWGKIAFSEFFPG